MGIEWGSWSWLFSFSVPNTFVMNQCLKILCLLVPFFLFCMTNHIFGHFSPTFFRLSLRSFILFPLFFFPTSSTLSLNPFCEFSSSLWRLHFSQLLSSHLLSCWRRCVFFPRAGRHSQDTEGAAPPEESAVAWMNPCLGWIFVWKSRGMFLSILLSVCSLSSPTFLCVNTVWKGINIMG